MPLILSAPDVPLRRDPLRRDAVPRRLPRRSVPKRWTPPQAWFNSLRSQDAAQALSDALPWDRKHRPPGDRDDWLGVNLPQWGAQFYLRRCLP